MRKTGLIALLLPTVMLSSCDLTVFDYWIDGDCDLRVVRYSGRDKTVAVDEYYYHGDKYDGEINITIPESIGVDGEGLKVKALGDGLFAYIAKHAITITDYRFLNNHISPDRHGILSITKFAN